MRNILAFARLDCDHPRDHWVTKGRGSEPVLSSLVVESAPPARCLARMIVRSRSATVPNNDGNGTSVQRLNRVSSARSRLGTQGRPPANGVAPFNVLPELVMASPAVVSPLIGIVFNKSGSVYAPPVER